MSSQYTTQLEAAIRQLEDMRNDGVSYVPVDPQLIESLAQPVSTPRAHSRPKPPPVSQRPLSPPATSKAAPPAAPPAQPAPTSPVYRTEISSEEKTKELDALRQRALVCMKCTHLADTRQNVVFGVGSVNASVMFIGEAPGIDEDQQGEPFVGKAGQLLTKIIQTMGLTRETVYIANILKCRPDTPGQSLGNRKPRTEEMATCIAYLQAQIDIIQPKLIVALGATAVEGLLSQKEIRITRLRGNWQTFRELPLMPTFHPSYVLRNNGLSVKRCVWEDMLKVMEKLKLPINEKQRNFFLPKNR